MRYTPWDVLVWVCWGLFAIVWTAGAVYNARRSPAVRERSGRSAAWLVWVAVIWVLLAIVPRHDWDPLTADVPALQVLGGILLVGSTAFAFWARGALGRMWSSAPLAREGHELRTGGPYGVTRHPIYTGILGMIAGSALVAGMGPNVLILVVVTVGLEMKIRKEERLMTQTFPGDYEEYRRRVPQIVPGLYLIPGLGGR